jgi:hypothetical protein
MTIILFPVHIIDRVTLIGVGVIFGYYCYAIIVVICLANAELADST